MNLKVLFACFLALGVLLAGCVNVPAGNAVECNKPYIRVGAGCCLDQNANAICDSDETTAPAIQATSIPTVTPEPLIQATLIPTATLIAIPSPASEITASPTQASTSTPVPTATATPSPIPTSSPTPVPTATLTEVPTATPSPTPIPTPTPVPYCSGPIYGTLTSSLLTKSNECRTSRVAGLCSACPTCCTGPTSEKTEYEQSIDATCYSCAYNTYKVARARDYYDSMGVYEKICTPCPSLATAYSALLDHANSSACIISDGWKLCKDVGTTQSTYPASCSGTVYSALTSALMSASNTCYYQRVANLCSACSTCCTNPTTAKTEYDQSIDANCYSCTSKVYGVARARDYYDRGGTYEKICAGCSELNSTYTALLQYRKDNACSISGWEICNDVSLP